MKFTPILPVYPSLGCDPELFISNGEETVESFELLKEEKVFLAAGKLSTDGVQIELNPTPSTCRQSLCYNLTRCFQNLYNRLEQSKLLANFSQSVNLTEIELDKMRNKAKEFGCAPSNNVHHESKIKVNAVKYRKRSAGGHIHIGKLIGGGSIDRPVFKPYDPSKLVPIFDIVLGNTCVLIDRNPANAERREIYGKAGEYRTPAHGIEYRTLSNFWLRSPVLFSFVHGLARQCVAICYNELWRKKFFSAVNINDVIEAINTNNYEMALFNYKKIEPLIAEAFPLTYNFSLFRDNLSMFNHFFGNKIEYWFDEHIINRWIQDSSHSVGWELFLDMEVRKDMVAPKL